MTTFTVSELGREYGRALLATEPHKHLRGVRIRFVDSDAAAPKAGGCAQLGKVKVFSDWERFLTGDGEQSAGDQVAIILLRETWGGMVNDEARSALDHLFGHIRREGEKIVVDAGHDVEVNLSDIDRTGAWSHGLKRLRERLRQLPLDAEPTTVGDTDPYESDEEDFGDGVPIRVEYLPSGDDPKRRALVAGIRAPGVRCSDCGSSNVHSLRWQEVPGGAMWSGFVCRDCGSTFTLALPSGEATLALNAGDENAGGERVDPKTYDNADGRFTGGTAEEQAAHTELWETALAELGTGETDEPTAIALDSADEEQLEADSGSAEESAA